VCNRCVFASHLLVDIPTRLMFLSAGLAGLLVVDKSIPARLSDVVLEAWDRVGRKL
jgi:hypothetical protein